MISSSLLWFFGIHGSNVLESVTEKFFTPALQTNLQLVAAGGEPTEILTKQFFDVFVLMGGCGTAVSLFLAILFFSKQKSDLRLIRMGAFPMIFNINEILTFGLPVILNGTFFIPFLLTPIVSYLISYFAMVTGIVPLVISDVNWTVPVVAGGYIATHSIRGILLQLLNIFVGVLIYRPFVLANDRKNERQAQQLYKQLVDTLKTSESTLVPVNLTSLGDRRAALARALTDDIRTCLHQGELTLYYQPQFNSKKQCIGAEALLRWNHPQYGMIYPPLIIRLAEEGNMLRELEAKVLLTVVNDAATIRKNSNFHGKISVNVTAETIISDSYMKLLADLMKQSKVSKRELCLEITEQSALIRNSEVIKKLRSIRQMGYLLSIDDFSMGHTSLAYLQESQFDMVKLDGSLIRGMEDNNRCTDIIQSIITLSQSLGFQVLAECVETDKQLEHLKKIGCLYYQGYLYSPAVPIGEFISLLNA